MNERQAHAQAERMTALWQLVTSAEAAGGDPVAAVLTTGAQALRPPQRFFGTIARLDGNELVIEGTTCPVTGPKSLGTGARVALAELPPPLVVDRMTTYSWPDITDDPTRAVCHSLGGNSIVQRSARRSTCAGAGT
jgi:hypothetical protein